MDERARSKAPAQTTVGPCTREIDDGLVFDTWHIAKTGFYRTVPCARGTQTLSKCDPLPKT